MSPLKNKFLTKIFIYLNYLFIQLINGQQQSQPFQSEECKKAATNCENSTDCVHRLAVLQSACVTNTCQPQCREAALNLYQNREGRNLLRTDASCVPGRYELEKCGFLPNKLPKHCLLAKLICEIDLQCNSKWEVFISECEANKNNNDIQNCSDKCRKYLNSTLSTQQGIAFSSCTCTDKEDGRCIQLREGTLQACLRQTSGEEEGPLPRPNITPTQPEEEETSSENEIESNNIISTSHSQSDVPAGTLSTFKYNGWILCNSKWEVFISECEANKNNNDIQNCSDKCRKYLNSTLSTQQGIAFSSCTCTDKEDGRCIQLREGTLQACLRQTSGEEEGPLPRPNITPTQPEEEETSSENEIESNNIISTSHSQSDVPAGTISTIKYNGWSLVIPSMFLSLLTALIFN